MIEDGLGELSLWKDAAASKILEELSQKHSVPISVLKELVSLQRENAHKGKARGINDNIDMILDQME
ncbi:DNA modification system-associated small protein [Pseudomonas aeruginosa]|uniref:DNA modification system-associated small protein n=1 Tax=Pseudomonas aeruginosa TaxID=287 RepID=UPI000A684862|nr:DNA modification system-associated small protein [Pseudomonas aeruginosa]EKY4188073.1 hypothetical protein [Pseudomonas aeruginosa]ELL1259466.1 hypothetical protein [Pseudomonas aeruginosa]ELT3989355.1 hypothetical protein [Pseudomonas aeruginosa]MBG4839700.1 hypothetical protein [Pseudomonas aeruginosa]MBH3713541.1 hypothetical protein [Pseudomonas aeruginosa]